MTDETHFCPSRESTPKISGWPDHDTWRVLPNGDRTCSFCGSLHPDDWMRLMDAAKDPDTKTWIDPSDKGYKFYVHQDGVANASDGGIKFYTWHIPSDEWAAKANAIHKEVLVASQSKMAARMARLFPTKGAADDRA